jgi:hypothetical protein
LLCLSLLSTASPPGQRINSPPDALSLLAELMVDADAPSRAGFSDILLSVLHDAYAEEIRLASAELPGSAQRAAKLRRWAGAMRAQQLAFADARLALSEGANVSVRVDRQRQVLVFVANQAIAFAAPRPGTEAALADAIVARYCALYDCRLLDGLVEAPDRLAPRATGNWSLSAGRKPAYEIEGVIRCAFRDLSGRQHKQRACQQLAEEARRLVEAIRQARDRGHVLDWKAIARMPRIHPPELLVAIDDIDNYVSVVAPRLAGTAADAWPPVADWLRQTLAGRTSVLLLDDGERWLPVQHGAEQR